MKALDAILADVERQGIESVAVCFLYSYVNPIHEQSVRERILAYGLCGGQDGATGINRLIQDGEERVLAGKATTYVAAGDRLVIETPGGGGWGEADVSEESS